LIEVNAMLGIVVRIGRIQDVVSDIAFPGVRRRGMPLMLWPWSAGVRH